MVYLRYLESLMFSTIGKLKLNMDEYLCGHIIGIGAVILNGYSYEHLIGRLTYLCEDERIDGLCDDVCRYIYIKDYKMPDYGFENCISTPERTICDLLMYPDELDAYLWLGDALEGYLEDDETPNDFHLVYEMMEVLGVDKHLLDKAIKGYIG
jgi:hypothetical protein